MIQAIADFDWNGFAATIVSRLIDGAVSGLAIGVIAGILLWICRHQSARSRFLILFSALAAMVALPFGKGYLSPFHLFASSLPVHRHSALILPATWANFLLCIWAVVVVAGLARIAVAFRRLLRLRCNCTSLDFNNIPLSLREMLLEFDSRRPVHVCVSDQVHTPTAIGLFRPAIMLPPWCLDENEVSSEELRQIVLHELAHLRRWDDWTNLAQKLLKTLFWVHPAIWWIEPRISLTREMACDEAVLKQTKNPLAYARCLTHLAEKLHLKYSLELAQAAVGRARQITARVLRILDLNAVQPQIRPPKLALIGVTAVLALSATSLMPPQLVLFRAPAIRADASQAVPEALPMPRVVPVSWKPAGGSDIRGLMTKLPIRSASQTIPASRVQHGNRASGLNYSETAEHMSSASASGGTRPATLMPVLTQLSSGRILLVVTEYEVNGPGFSSVHMEMWQVVLPATHPQIYGGVSRRTL